MNEKSIAVIIGSPGTGKTTLANFIRKKINAETLIFDNMHIQINTKQRIEIQKALREKDKKEKVVFVVQPSDYIFHRFNYLLDHDIVWIFTSVGPDIETLEKSFLIPGSILRKFNKDFFLAIKKKHKFRPCLFVTVDPIKKELFVKLINIKE